MSTPPATRDFVCFVQMNAVDFYLAYRTFYSYWNHNRAKRICSTRHRTNERQMHFAQRNRQLLRNESPFGELLAFIEILHYVDIAASIHVGTDRKERVQQFSQTSLRRSCLFRVDHIWRHLWGLEMKQWRKKIHWLTISKFVYEIPQILFLIRCSMSHG